MRAGHAAQCGLFLRSIVEFFAPFWAFRPASCSLRRDLRQAASNACVALGCLESRQSRHFSGSAPENGDVGINRRHTILFFVKYLLLIAYDLTQKTGKKILAIGMKVFNLAAPSEPPCPAVQ
jgi:hypothetical protein